MLSQKEFSKVVEEALKGLPQEFLDVLDNIAVVVEEEPAEEDLEVEGFDPDDELLGIFRGTALTDRSFDGSDLPSQIVIFRGPVLRCCETSEEAIEEIRDTVVHELGHYFGLDDHEMPF
ncbi:MAG TPA: metallopeptidase family protein [Thermoanaerobaculia bacterium]|nr:metallopeptidase family protein [Thermoanaerobaculia bacterium]